MWFLLLKFPEENAVDITQQRLRVFEHMLLRNIGGIWVEVSCSNKRKQKTA
jgi:hypothetical protein